MVHQGQETAIISAKWSIRHDRLKDLLEECSYFKSVRPGIRFHVATNEYMPARLERLAASTCIDNVFHVRTALLRLANPGVPHLAAIRDLSDLFTLFL